MYVPQLRCKESLQKNIDDFTAALTNDEHPVAQHTSARQCIVGDGGWHGAKSADQRRLIDEYIRHEQSED